MSRIQDYSSRVDILNTDPLIATLTFETDYSKSVLRVSYDREIGKYWVQRQGNRFHCHPLLNDAYPTIADINTESLAIAVYLETRQRFAEGLGKHGITVDNSGGRLVIGFDNPDATWTEMPDEDLRAFALHVLKEFDTRYVPSLDEIAREVVAGLREIAAARVGEAA
ncbi:hypothetical protein [Agrobacterium genomosp. 2]|uniref:Uncharacterized protein n=1 Tax=Agrobacterium genomosp. 2 str. CFBP 5494 TaxID=1183436 RepID=A0A9W5AYL1_9HYPH|nr:hypothetical protein [Agrobacterium genomosp. 2]CUW87513.1 hypothetical protein AGR2A_Cc120078 [Agrobacterium genomosp. 2 str. CFBP 5494]